MTVEHLFNEMSSAELIEWQGYDLLQPIGDERADLRAGIVAAAIANFAGKQLPEGKRADPFEFTLFNEDR